MSPFMWRKVFMALYKGGTTEVSYCIDVLKQVSFYVRIQHMQILISSPSSLALCFSYFPSHCASLSVFHQAGPPPRPPRPSSRSAPLHPECANVFGCVCVLPVAARCDISQMIWPPYMIKQAETEKREISGFGSALKMSWYLRDFCQSSLSLSPSRFLSLHIHSKAEI